MARRNEQQPSPKLHSDHFGDLFDDKPKSMRITPTVFDLEDCIKELKECGYPIEAWDARRKIKWILRKSEMHLDRRFRTPWD